MGRWEYQVVETRHVHQSYLEPILNEHGAEGWELVSAFLTPNLTTFIFKRHIEGAAKSQDEAAA